MIHEEEDYEDEFEEYEESDEDYFEEDDDEESETDTRTYDEGPRISRMDRFAEDPWPPLTFILTLIGLAIVLFTPPPIWAAANYLIFGTYVLVIVTGVATSMGITAWKEETESRMRLAAPIVLVITFACLIVGVLDSLLWILNGVGLVAEWGSPVVTFCITIALFGVYSLYFIRRTVRGESR
ncbi:MAG: hypothetical protein JSW61_04120 [Candidatus Thorarchaeota archaeon]|nr:MAG: hypothetical protein JSW61_04120 [Candidatus Thorarchaeota archaeon]